MNRADGPRAGRARPADRPRPAAPWSPSSGAPRGPRRPTGGPGRTGTGDPVDPEPDGIPVFRAPQAAVTVSRPPFAPARAPGRMSIGGTRDEQHRGV